MSTQLASGSDLAARYDATLMRTYGAPQRVLVRGAGCHVWDADGRRYLDLLGGIAVNALGHAHPKVVEAVTTQLTTLGHVSNFFATPPQIAVAERLLSLLGASTGRVFLTNSGTEANEAALKATRRTGRTKVVAAEGAFHGRSMGALALTWKPAYREPFEPLPGEVVFVDFGDADALAAAVDDRTAAVVLEPIQGESGIIVPPAGYLAKAREITKRAGALLWIDEIQTGIGRTGAWFAHAESGIVPDLVTVAKGLGAGFPIGACIGIGDAGDLLGPGDHGTTFGGNPVAAAAALATIDVITDDGLLERTMVAGEHLAARIGTDPGVDHVRGRGLLRGIALAAPAVPADPAPAVAKAALDAGFIVNAPNPHTLRLAPPLLVGLDQLDTFVDALPELLDATQADLSDAIRPPRQMASDNSPTAEEDPS
jgi:acetylornithine/N-succinyldiaminopimelate aminotransferase